MVGMLLFLFIYSLKFIHDMLAECLVMGPLVMFIILDRPVNINLILLNFQMLSPTAPKAMWGWKVCFLAID